MAKASTSSKSVKDVVNIKEAKKNAGSLIEKILGDISKTSASKQMILGVSSGWFTGFMAMRVGKPTALALGGGIILLQIANEKGLIKINWDKVNRKIDKVADKVEEVVTGQQPTVIDKVERFVDRKIAKTEETLKSQSEKAKRWYTKILGEEQMQLKEMHIFVVSFVAGVAIGIGSS
ncbi:FUN14 domain-containing protein 1 [Coccinella septempunctata]|uniref:FUN14 domain-containing protein 1 n=1 Tax=Coccinella septempunctata TaxID=41139 RepID=UPI001D08EBA6|nr:FUN14 domain-containing protein 1 [Coccinella septempunctata]